METLMIFLPHNLNLESSGYLYGFYKDSNSKTCKTFYILGLFDITFDDDNFCEKHLIGSFCGNHGSVFLDLKTENWVLIGTFNNELLIEKVHIKGEEIGLEHCHIIRYCPSLFKKSELLPSSDKDNEYNEDYFKVLVHYLKIGTESRKTGNANWFILLLLTFFQYITVGLDKINYITCYTTIGLHLKEHSKNIKWLLENLAKSNSITLHCGNYITSLTLDMIGGFIVTNLLAKWANEQEIFEWIASNTEDVLESINLTIKWLMGSPGGLKLNYPLNYILGNFFLYNIYLWWTFLGLVRPILEVAFLLFLKMGFLGLSFQIALMADIFSLVSFHLYCIYIYAAKLFNIQVKGLCSLSRIFFGRKRNPEPGKVDSCPYTTEQLFLGTVCFTVLLFILPTTLVYYIVFTLIRIGATMIGGILTRARYMIEILPLYSSFIWLFRPDRVTTTVQLIPIRGLSTAGSVTLIAVPVNGTWLEATQRCIPEVISKPLPVNCKEVGSCILSGRLIYQI